MIERDLSKNHKINNLKVVMSYADYLGPEVSFHNINQKGTNLVIPGHQEKRCRKGSRKEMDHYMELLPQQVEAIFQVAV